MKERLKLSGLVLLIASYFIAMILAAQSILKYNPELSVSAYYSFAGVVVIGFCVSWILLSKNLKQLRSYITDVGDSVETDAFKSFAWALKILFYSLVFTAFLNTIRTPEKSHLHDELTIAIYLLAGGLSFLYFLFIGRAGHILARSVEKNKSFIKATLSITALTFIVTLGLWYALRSDTANANHILHYWSDTMALVVLYLPLALGWGYGLTGAYGFYLYQKNVSGAIYKSLARNLIVGTITLVLVSSARHISDYARGSSTLVTLNDDILLITGLLTVLILALSLVHRGIAKLHAIETVK